MESLPIGLQRLLRLAAHLEGGQLGHATFDFNNWHIGGSLGTCGTSGCAIGECPFVWPNDWCFENEFPKLQNQPEHGAMTSAETWFSLSYDEARHLFIPGRQDPEQFGGEHLEETATKEQVASNIREFVAIESADI
jgi:hypothetical protein